MKHSILWFQWLKCTTYWVASFGLQKICVPYVICFPLSVILHWTPSKYFLIADGNIYALLAMYQFVCSLKRNIPFGIRYYFFQFIVHDWLITPIFFESHPGGGSPPEFYWSWLANWRFSTSYTVGFWKKEKERLNEWNKRLLHCHYENTKPTLSNCSIFLWQSRLP
jgi:hypothetical protein